MAAWLQQQWAKFTVWHLLLLPISWLFGALIALRKSLYHLGILKSEKLDVPVVVVGNLNVGGTGKTPLVIWLVAHLKAAGYVPGVISRGYGAPVKQVLEVTASSVAAEVGDEPLLIAMRAKCPVLVSPNRVAAAQALLAAHPTCNIIISDDGLQHYRLQRDVEIVVYDGTQKFGNGALLPAGPLREPASRLNSVDAIVCNAADHQAAFIAGHPAIQMQMEATDFYNLADTRKRCHASAFADKKVVAVAGIGHPERFFRQLQALGVNAETRAFVDHHAFQVQDFMGVEADVFIMTEKDAVKCQSFARDNFWVLPVNALIQDDLIALILAKLNQSH